MLFDLCRSPPPHSCRCTAAATAPCTARAPTAGTRRAEAAAGADTREGSVCWLFYTHSQTWDGDERNASEVCVEKATLLDPRGARQPGAGALHHDAPHAARFRGRPGRSSSTPRLRKAAAGRGKGGISANCLADEATTSDTNKLLFRRTGKTRASAAGARGHWTYPRRAAGRQRPCLRRWRGRRTRPSVDLPSSFLAGWGGGRVVAKLEILFLPEKMFRNKQFAAHGADTRAPCKLLCRCSNAFRSLVLVCVRSTGA
jgi:hypothetical protein